MNFLDQLILHKESRLTEKKKKNLKRFILYEDGRFRVFWANVLLLLLLYTISITPFRIAFVEQTDSDFWNFFFMDITVDFLFLCDILVTMNSTFRDSHDK
jgi:hypothetical protein